MLACLNSKLPITIDDATISATVQINSLSTLSFKARIWLLKSLDSLVVMDAAMTARETPHARPN